ncbi:MAG TPA: PAS domain S-box protein [Xanthobacteraceae bacterium]|jgi:PAS domain S-box-containing protein|nr:PAS domain S-box protein [Xanthobacteraceae bacterium]
MKSDPALLEALSVAVYMTDATGFLTFYNSEAARLWGTRPPIGSTQWSGAFRLFTRDGTPVPHNRCPEALTLQGEALTESRELVAERPDGTLMAFLSCPSLLRDQSGNVVGSINVLVELGEAGQSDLELARLAAIVSSSDDAIISKNLEGRINSWNAAATRVFGYEASEMVGRSILTIIPIELHDEERQILAKVERGERIEHFDTVRLTKDGRRIDVSLTVSPLRNRLGKVIGASKIARDVTERKRDEQLQRLLFEELNHRVKNTLATVQALAGQSLRSSTSPAAFVSSFNGRIQSLAKAHDVLVTGKMKGADVSQIVREQVTLGRAEDTRITVTGPAAFLNAKSAVNLSLALHELATNARKYGALSFADGHLSIAWKVHSYPKRELTLEWRETGVPNLQEPRSRGFGTTLIERTLESEGGKGIVRYTPEGVVCDLILPLVNTSPLLDLPVARHLDAESQRIEQVSKKQLLGKRIIIVEDEILLALDIEHILTEAGYHVVGRAGTLDKAKDLIADTSCDLALLDANLAGARVDDLALALAIRRIPFLFATGYGKEGTPQGFRDVPVLAKPFSAEQLLSAVERLLLRD